MSSSSSLSSTTVSMGLLVVGFGEANRVRIEDGLEVVVDGFLVDEDALLVDVDGLPGDVDGIAFVVGVVVDPVTTTGGILRIFSIMCSCCFVSSRGCRISSGMSYSLLESFPFNMIASTEKILRNQWDARKNLKW